MTVSEVFTDDDLATLKEDIANGGWSYKLPALLARLEAAEKVCAEWEANANLEHKCTLNDLHRAWREAAGK